MNLSGNEDSLIGLIAPKSNSTILIYDVHASESGALAILTDLYNQIKNYNDKSVRWIFVVSTPEYADSENITVLRFPWVKKSWGHRLLFDSIYARMILRKYHPDQVFSLQNKGLSFFRQRQLVYLHLPFVLTDHRFDIKVDGKKLWLYQNVLSKSIFASLRKVDLTIVQTQWMKEALVEKAHVRAECIAVLPPDITVNRIGSFKNTPENRRCFFFYPATAFTYKNHQTMLRALKIAQECGLTDYRLILTIREDDNSYTQQLAAYSKEHHLNVVFQGPMPREQVFEMYTRSVLLFPSYVESFGLPLLEARLSNTFIIASDCSFSREILAGYEKACFFSEMDAQAMASSILEIGGVSNG